MDEQDILEEKPQEDNQMESEETIQLIERETTEELKTKLLSEIDEEDKKKLQKFSAQQLLDLKRKDCQEIFGTIDGIRYFNHFSRVKVKTLLIKKIGKTWNKKRKRTN